MRNRPAAFQGLKAKIQKDGWGSSREGFLKQIDIGETLWVIGRGGPPETAQNCEWRLLVQLYVSGYDRHPNNLYQYRLLTRKFDFMTLGHNAIWSRFLNNSISRVASVFLRL